AGCHAVSRGVEAEILVHGERGEADIDAIETAKEINQDGQRQEPPIDLAHGRSLDARDAIIAATSKRNHKPFSPQPPARKHRSAFRRQMPTKFVTRNRESIIYTKILNLCGRFCLEEPPAISAFQIGRTVDGEEKLKAGRIPPV